MEVIGLKRGQITSGAGRGATRQPGPFTWRRPPSPGPRAWRNLPGSFPPGQSLLELALGSVRGAPALISPAAPQGGSGKGRAGQDTGRRMCGMCQAHLPTPGEGRGRGPAEGRGEGRGSGRRRKPVCSPAGGAQSVSLRRPARSPQRSAPRAPSPTLAAWPGLGSPRPASARPSARHASWAPVPGRAVESPSGQPGREAAGGTGPLPSLMTARMVTGTTPGFSFPIHNLHELQASPPGLPLGRQCTWFSAFHWERRD